MRPWRLVSFQIARVWFKTRSFNAADSIRDAVKESVDELEDATRATASSLERKAEEAAEDAARTAILTVTSKVSKSIKSSLESLVEQTATAIEENHELFRSNVLLVVRAEVDNAVSLLTQEVNELLGKIEHSVAAMRKAMDSKEEKKNDGFVIKASYEESVLPKVAPIVDEVRAESDARKVKALVGKDAIQLAPAVPSILDDLDVPKIRAH